VHDLCVFVVVSLLFLSWDLLILNNWYQILVGLDSLVRVAWAMHFLFGYGCEKMQEASGGQSNGKVRGW